jgi:hypothetical protein
MSSTEHVTCLRIRRILHDLANEFTVTPIDADTFVVSTPFRSGDGEMLSIVLERRGTAWRLTAPSQALERPGCGPIPLTDAHIGLLEGMIDSSGHSFSDSHVISAEREDLPKLSDIADMIQLEAGLVALSEVFKTSQPDSGSPAT